MSSSRMPRPKDREAFKRGHADVVKIGRACFDVNRLLEGEGLKKRAEMSLWLTSVTGSEPAGEGC